jgi:Arc/MetJ family transcription regulator
MVRSYTPVMHMRTTLDLPEGLLEKAQELTGAATKRETVVGALEEVIKSELRQRLIDRLGKTKLNLTAEDVRVMRQGRKPPPKGSRLFLIHPAEERHRCEPKFIPDWDDES